jgi:hypothetical protein
VYSHGRSRWFKSSTAHSAQRHLSETVTLTFRRSKVRPADLGFWGPPQEFREALRMARPKSVNPPLTVITTLAMPALLLTGASTVSALTEVPRAKKSTIASLPNGFCAVEHLHRVLRGTKRLSASTTYSQASTPGWKKSTEGNLLVFVPGGVKLHAGDAVDKSVLARRPPANWLANPRPIPCEPQELELCQGRRTCLHQGQG